MKSFNLITCLLLLLSCYSSSNKESLDLKVYRCGYTSESPVIDGILNDNSWKKAMWSDVFIDIEGDIRPKPYHNTKVKLLWDSNYLYIAAHLEEEHIWGYNTEKNSAIYKFGNDFEVFIDPDRDHHHYYELELNVLNTIWELTLEKPYRNGGPAIDPTNLPNLRTAVNHQGTVNDASDIDTAWTVEIAIPFIELHNYRQGDKIVAPKPLPDHGDIWGLNFSRVHYDFELNEGVYEKAKNRPEYNWVWSKQGEINMHAPEKWGLLIFEKGTEVAIDYEEEMARQDIMHFYRIQKSHFKQNGKYMTTIPDTINNAVKAVMQSDTMENSFQAYKEFTSQSGQRNRVWVNQDSRLWIKPNKK